MNRLLLLFVDGVGLAPAGDSNPLATTPTPALSALLGGPLTVEQVQRRDGLLLCPIDAGLGVDGLPQSATGQTALFTGVNAPRHMGHHVAAFPGPRLRAILAEHSVLKRAAGLGFEVTFANPFTRAYFERLESRRRRTHSATTWTALAAGIDLRSAADLAAGRAVSWDVRRDRFQAALSDGEPAVPVIDEATGGRHLAALAASHHLTLWETFLTDLAGHFRFGITAAEAIGRVDGLLGGLLAARPDDLTVVLTSDHGNVEAGGHKRHTRNPVPLLAVGPAAERFAGVEALTDVAGALLDALGGEAA
ncbi:MAG TPA: metalloenzyme [Thermoanaerobaculia bacterium]|nr:metalloenzyme [Thermoanaerobaculia bacterium]